jgi:hypothetical protein
MTGKGKIHCGERRVLLLVARRLSHYVCVEFCHGGDLMPSIRTNREISEAHAALGDEVALQGRRCHGREVIQRLLDAGFRLLELKADSQ